MVANITVSERRALLPREPRFFLLSMPVQGQLDQPVQ
jgi:hypothetical protein